jgi:hypothetical protein
MPQLIICDPGLLAWMALPPLRQGRCPKLSEKSRRAEKERQTGAIGTLVTI